MTTNKKTGKPIEKTKKPAAPKRAKNKVRTDSEFNWQKLLDDDIANLAKNLKRRALGDDGLTLSKEESLAHTKKILEEQNSTCLFAGGNSAYCWNEPRVDANILKLQWSHLIPMAHGPQKSIGNFVLLCARCNNQLQSSRTLSQLKDELTHKLVVISKILKQTHGDLAASVKDLSSTQTVNDGA